MTFSSLLKIPIVTTYSENNGESVQEDHYLPQLKTYPSFLQRCLTPGCKDFSKFAVFFGKRPFKPLNT